MGKGGGDSSELGLVTKKNGKQKLMTGIGASLTPYYRDKEESNNTSQTGQWLAGIVDMQNSLARAGEGYQQICF